MSEETHGTRFETAEILADRQKYSLCRAQDRTTGRSCLLKILKEQYVTTADVTWLEHEYRLLVGLHRSDGTAGQQLENVVKPLAITQVDGCPALLMEDIGGLPLTSVLRPGLAGIREVTSLAVRLARTLGQIHAANLVHLQVCPSNILLSPKDGRFNLINFRLATELSQEGVAEQTRAIDDIEDIDATLAYVAPELTGRTGRNVDYRADYYSLGVTLWELLTGRLPFATTDPLELVHSHIAKLPPAPHEVADQVPVGLSHVVMKLLAKNAEDRYQSASGLIYDVERALTRLHRNRPRETFPLGEGDGTGCLSLKRKVYGRESELASLMAAFERAQSGEATVVFITGESGIGKSTLVAELHHHIADRCRFFVSSKSDQHVAQRPYQAMAQTFGGIVRQCLTGTEEQLRRDRETILRAITPNGQVLIDWLPELEFIIGPQPPVFPVGIHETHNRFLRTFLLFVDALVSDGKPLVLFVDDLQWADRSSIALLEALARPRAGSPLLILGAYRDDEVDEQGPLTELIRAQRSPTGSILELDTLAVDDVGSLIEETLQNVQGSADDLVKLVHRKTGGNPFFLRSFLQTLFIDHLLVWDAATLSWQADVTAIDKRDYASNVVDHMLVRLRALPESEQRLVATGAVLGWQFNVSSLAAILNVSQERARDRMQGAIEAGLLEPAGVEGAALGAQSPEGSSDHPAADIDARIKFSHDRVQQAALMLLPTAQRSEIHRTLGLELLDAHQFDPKYLFEATRHLNAAADLIEEPTHRSLAAQANLHAARRAKEASAYDEAYECIVAATEFLGPDPLTDHPFTRFEYTLERAEIEYLGTKFDDATRSFALAEELARDDMEKIAAKRRLVKCYLMGSDMQRGYDVSLEALAVAGFELEAEPSTELVEEEISHFLTLYDGITESDILAIPPMSDQRLLAVQGILQDLEPLTYSLGSNNYFRIGIKSAELTIRHGNSCDGAYAFTHLATLTFSAFLGDLTRALRFGRIAFALQRQYSDPAAETAALLSWNAAVALYAQPYEQTERDLRPIVQRGLESGAYNWAGYAAVLISMLAMQRGRTLKTADEQMIELEGRIERFDPRMTPLLRCHRSAIYNLAHAVDDWSQPALSVWPEGHTLTAYAEDGNNSVLLFVIGVLRLALANFYGNVQAARAQITVCRKVSPRVGPHVDLFCFHEAIGLASSCVHPGEHASRDLTDAVRRAEQELARRAQLCASTYGHRAALIGAELARISGDVGQAEVFYDEAIAKATQSQFAPDAALCNQRAAMFHLALGRIERAAKYLHAARFAYLQWGAHGVVSHLEKTYSALLDKEGARGSPRTLDSTQLDQATLFKAVQALSGEIQLDALITKLLAATIENTGATRCGLVLRGDAPSVGPIVESVVDSTHDSYKTVVMSEQLDRCTELPRSVVRLAMRTGRSVFVGAREDDSQGFRDDEYIVRESPKSALACPIAHQGNIAGVLYAENRVTHDAFTEEHLRTVRILATQAAIAIENALLFRQKRAFSDELMAERQFINMALDALTDTFFAFDPATQRPRRWNKAFSRVSGYSDAEIREQEAPNAYYGAADLIAVNRALEAVRAEGHATCELSLITRNGEVVPTEYSFSVVRDETNSVDYIIAIGRDVTERKRAEEERERLQAQLSQSQKMESVGRLAGGVAHDFNNMLAVILGFAEIVLEDLDPKHPAHRQVAQILKAAKHSTALTQQLLAFARKQTVTPQVLRVNETVSGFIQMLKRLIGEDIDLRWVPAKELPPTFMDASQVEQILINLCVNARDAIRGAGRITIETSNVSVGSEYCNTNMEAVPGEYVSLTVSDDGIGMTKENMARVFEPFFTTKTLGQGTGLGLATVYGIVKQNGGFINVYSESGHGTRFTIYLPRHIEEDQQQIPTRPVPEERLAGRHETILLVEDEEFVMEMTTEMLERQGYVVLAASSPNEAVRHAKEHSGSIDLLMTDVVMPGMNGPALAEVLTAIHPHVKVLFTSGYTANVIAQHGVLDGRVNFIQKPFNKQSLAEKVREVLHPAQKS